MWNYAPLSDTRLEPCVKHTVIYGVSLLTDNTMKMKKWCPAPKRNVTAIDKKE
jgi:hypothetical protein